MSDLEALCYVTQLNPTQLAGLVHLADMSDAQIAEFATRVGTAWDANEQAVADAHDAVKDAMTRRLEVETEVARACRNERRSFPTDDESARCWEARQAWLKAKDDLEAAQKRFKQGVTEEQLT